MYLFFIVVVTLSYCDKYVNRLSPQNFSMVDVVCNVQNRAPTLSGQGSGPARDRAPPSARGLSMTAEANPVADCES